MNFLKSNYVRIKLISKKPFAQIIKKKEAIRSKLRDDKNFYYFSPEHLTM